MRLPPTHAAALLVLLLAVGCADRAPAPDKLDPTSPQGLAASVEIVRDTWGVPHIYAPTDAAVVFGAAWAQAEDNWWQVEDNFVRSLGRGAELHGEEAFLDDYLVRAMEIRRRSIEEYESTPPEMRALYDAYAAGLNFYLERHPEVRRRLLSRIEPWYTLALIRFKYHHNEYIGYAGLRRRGTELLLEQPDYGRAGEPEMGSNQIALAGSRTASGYPMLLINPHVPFFGLSQYWEVHLQSDEGLVFSGLSRFGFLLPYMGNNEALGWAYTDNYADIGDLYVEHFDDPEHPLRYRYGDGYREAAEWRETIAVRTDSGGEQREVTLRKTHHGPILGVDDEGRPLAVRLARLDEGGWFHQWYEMERAQSLAEWRQAMSRLNVAYMNTMYADRDGNILYIYNSAVPRRSTEYDWRNPVDGSDPGTEWNGYHTLDELPQQLLPETGYLQNCNSTPFQATPGLAWSADEFPPYMIGPEEHNTRARSATRILDGMEGVTLDEFAEAVLDTRMIAAETMLPGLLAEYDRLAGSDLWAERMAGPIEELRSWDTEATLDSVAATLFVLWAREDGEDLAALERIIDSLERDWGRWRVAWGEINRAQRPDASGSVPFSDDLPSIAIPGAPGWLGSLFTYHGGPADGTIRHYGGHGNSFVKVIEFGPQPVARSVLVFGQSGDPDSPHFADQTEIYASKRFKPAWFARREVEANAERTYRPGSRRRDK